MAEQKKTKIAILPFPDLQRQTVTLLGSFIAEELTTDLFTTGKFKIVERNLLKQVLNELKLGQTGAVDAASAKQLGKLTGVDAIIAGTIADLGSNIAVNCRLIETETGEIFSAAKAKIKKDENILKIFGETIENTDIKEINAKVKNEVTEKNISEGVYDVEADEIDIPAHYKFGMSKIEVSKAYLKINFYVKSYGFGGTFYLKEAYILNPAKEKHDLKKVEGLEHGKGGISVGGIKVEKARDSYSKNINANSSIWGSLYFPRFDMKSADFLLYINGYEASVKLVQVQK